MSEGEVSIDGARVCFRRAHDDSWQVSVRGRGKESELVDIGSLERTSDGSGFVVRRTDGRVLTRSSPWGGRVTVRFGSRELAARALLDEGR